jgi:hypothetical protein
MDIEGPGLLNWPCWPFSPRPLRLLADGTPRPRGLFGNVEIDAERTLWREGLLLCPCPRELTFWITACASAPSYGLIVATVPDDEIRMGGGFEIVQR